MKALLITLGIIIIIGVASVGSINNIPTLDENVKAQWSQLINQYKRRADLVPQLVETVKGSANFEKSTLENVIAARSKATAVNINADQLNNQESVNKFFEAQNGLGSALSKLMVVVERYPELKSTQNFLSLQSQLEGNENRISVARRDYIESVKTFNVTIRTFPGFLWNKIFFGKEPMANYTESEEVQKAPEIKFN